MWKVWKWQQFSDILCWLLFCFVVQKIRFSLNFASDFRGFCRPGKLYGYHQSSLFRLCLCHGIHSTLRWHLASLVPSSEFPLARRKANSTGFFSPLVKISLNVVVSAPVSLGNNFWYTSKRAGKWRPNYLYFGLVRKKKILKSFLLIPACQKYSLTTQFQLYDNFLRTSGHGSATTH